MTMIDIIDTPAWLIGEALGPLMFAAFMFASIAISLYVGTFMYRSVRYPVINVIIAVVVGLWIFAVVGRAATFTPAAWLHMADGRHDD